MRAPAAGSYTPAVVGDPFRVLRELVVNPGRAARRRPATQKAYKAFSNAVTARRRRLLWDLTGSLPRPGGDRAVPRDTGLRVIAPGTFPSAAALVARCQTLLGHAERRATRKAQLISLLTPGEIGQIPEFVKFCLDPDIVGIASAYLNELPIVGAVELWYSRPIGGDYVNSQLYHVDLDDVQQLKVFLFVSDVDLESGPLTVLPAHVSARVSAALGYRPASGRVRIGDTQIRPLLSPGEEVVLTGPKGTLAFVDTSRTLHFGSRVSSRERYVVMVQYLGLTNYVRNPFYAFEPWPFAHVAEPRHSRLQRAVLGEGVVRLVGRQR